MHSESLTLLGCIFFDKKGIVNCQPVGVFTVGFLFFDKKRLNYRKICIRAEHSEYIFNT